MMQFLTFYLGYVILTKEYFQCSNTEQKLSSQDVLEAMAFLEKDIFH